MYGETTTRISYNNCGSSNETPLLVHITRTHMLHIRPHILPKRDTVIGTHMRTYMLHRRTHTLPKRDTATGTYHAHVRCS